MPYYCTVPRCTSMAGKAKNVSFHQFPRDVELAKLWNDILKRGKPYTKYSKVCSLHFKSEDYTITSVGKNKGQWRTLRKDAIPSLNLPTESPPPSQRRSTSAQGLPGLTPNLMDPQIQQQVAQAIYMQTMLAMQAATFKNDHVETMDLSIRNNESQDSDESEEVEQASPNTSTAKPSREISELEKFLLKYEAPIDIAVTNDTSKSENTSYKCMECSKCFKDPDVFTIHKRTHKQNKSIDELCQKENLNTNIEIRKTKENLREDTLKANPILANLLKPDTPKVPDLQNAKNIEHQIMTAMALNMQAYIRNFSSVMNSRSSCEDSETESESHCVGLNQTNDSSRLIVDETV